MLKTTGSETSLNLERIEITPFALLAGEILQQRRTGSLTILRGSHRKTLYWSQGELSMAASDLSDESLGEFLVRRGVMSPEQAANAFSGDDGTSSVLRFHESGILNLSARQTLLREWLTSVFIPLFGLDEGTAAFSDEEPLAAERRVFIQSTAALILEGIRSIANGLILRRSLGDIKREIEPAHEGRFGIESVALTEEEQRIAGTLTGPQSIETFLKHFGSESLLAAKVVIGMLALGLFSAVDVRSQRPADANFADTQRDLELLATIGSGDQRSLRAIALSRQMPSMDHYQLLNVARAATRGQIVSAAEAAKRNLDPASYPQAVREIVQTILARIDEAVATLQDPARRANYDNLLSQTGGTVGGGAKAIQQRAAQRSIALQNLNRARQLSVEGDYYGAIVLLRQAVLFAPDLAEAWFLLGSCQERNPKWRREAVESFQMALSTDPDHIEALISLGDLYRTEGLTSRAQTCYEDALKISPGNQQATSRLKTMRKR